MKAIVKFIYSISTAAARSGHGHASPRELPRPSPFRLGLAFPRAKYYVHHMHRRPPSRKETSHERIVESASRAIRRNGYAGAGVADIMKDAGLTHGGFYAHFPSREAMLAEAADRAGADSLATLAQIASRAPRGQGLDALVAAYLSKAHAEGIESGCPLAASGSEVSRQSPEVRHAATRRIKELIDLVAREVPEWGQQGAHERALVTVATMVGALMLARAVDDTRLSDALRDAALRSLTSQTSTP
ncbi:TetR/AcrR family transcriptional regulator [Corallococcus coralloides]|uniref:TetR/AcrR family transcriptional regulator n=1 Tax=Corallococcus coralloides TaxID=184914 RepID=UPI00384FF8C7